MRQAFTHGLLIAQQNGKEFRSSLGINAATIKALEAGTGGDADLAFPKLIMRYWAATEQEREQARQAIVKNALDGDGSFTWSALPSISATLKITNGTFCMPDNTPLTTASTFTRVTEKKTDVGADNGTSNGTTFIEKLANETSPHPTQNLIK